MPACLDVDHRREAPATQHVAGERASARVFWEFHNLFNRFNKCNSVSNDASGSSWLQPLSGPISGPYCAVNGGVFGTGGGSFGPGTSTPFRYQFGLRIEF
ncbi:MAG TPA: hypothetical protein VF840_00810 [Terriglobales bacterium]